MPLDNLSPEELDILHRCLRVSADDTTLFEEWEFHTLMGIERSELLELLNRWPPSDETPAKIQCAIQNSLNNLLGYPHGHHDDWDEDFGFSRAQVVAVFAKCGGSLPANYVDGFR